MHNNTGKWKPSIHMPKDACRLFLQIKSIRVQRLNDISQSDARAEGVITSIKKHKPAIINQYGPNPDVEIETTPKFEFRALWHKINGPTSWVNNLWVWVIEFERIEKPHNFC